MKRVLLSSKSVAAVIAAFVAVLAAPVAGAQTQSAPNAAEAPAQACAFETWCEAGSATRMSQEEARAYIAEIVAAPRTQIVGCRAMRGESVAFRETGLTIACTRGPAVSAEYSQLTRAYFFRSWAIHGTYYNVCFSPGGQRECGRPGSLEFAYLYMGNPQPLVDAWHALQRPPPPLDPANDTAFLEALRGAPPASGERNEELRRAQVRAEAFVTAGRLDDALRAYQTALQTSPDWAAGRFNAALVAAELHNYTMAITEMRRYLYLTPNAPDARQAQDQIYRWEALLE